MERIKSPHLEKALVMYASKGRLHQCIRAVLEEDADYAADEIIALSEEVLSSFAAVGFSRYLLSEDQDEVYNDFLFGLFNGAGSGYNAGPLFRWAANMVLQCVSPEEDAFKFFWVVDEEGWKLNDELNQLAQLRNRVMHGFFLLPAHENNAFAEHIGSLLLRERAVRLFKSTDDFHFMGQEGFAGNWSVRKLDDWRPYFDCSEFGKRTKQIIHEESKEFWKLEDEFFSSGSVVQVPKQLREFLSKPGVGAMAIWHHPSDQLASDEIYRSIGIQLRNSANCTSICYRIDGVGYNFTASFLLRSILQHLWPEREYDQLKEDKLKQVLFQYRKEHRNERIVVLLQGVHLAMFSIQHVTSLFGFLFECGITVVAIGWRYRQLEYFFADSMYIGGGRAIPTRVEEFDPSIRNYFRFRTSCDVPFIKSADYYVFKSVFIHVLNATKNGVRIHARRFADENGLELEGVLEACDALHPWVEILRLEFEEDEWDEAAGVPRVLTESTQILLALGRTDLPKEYKHVVLSS